MTDVKFRPAVCPSCHYVAPPIEGRAHPEKCPQCDGEKWTLDGDVTSELTPIDELEIVARNAAGEVRAERKELQDHRKSASLAWDAGNPSKLSARLTEPLDGFADEGEAAALLAQALNASQGTDYIVPEKLKEDSDYADRYLHSASGHHDALNVQIRHLDPALIGELGGKSQATQDRSPENIVTLAQTAITKKAKVDPKLKPVTILLLICPTPLGQALTTELRKAELDTHGFRQVWVLPFHEQPFRIAEH